ncbi:MAG: recombination regulator RecX [Myxococcales bacterium]|nr:recombination regulator RecX [Myxococcales bacterium]
MKSPWGSSNKRKRSILDDAVRVLAHRSHGRKELEAKLRQRGHTNADIVSVFQRLEELSYLESDTELAERYALELARKRGATPLMTARKLRSRGFSEADSKAAVETAFQAWDPQAAALETVEGVSDPAKAARRLLNRGFPSDAVARVVSRLRDAASVEEDV